MKDTVTGSQGEMTVWWLFYFHSVMLRDDVLIENNKYGCVIMQNNWAMKKLTSRMHKWLKPGVLSAVHERRVRG